MGYDFLNAMKAANSRVAFYILPSQGDFAPNLMVTVLGHATEATRDVIQREIDELEVALGDSQSLKMEIKGERFRIVAGIYDGDEGEVRQVIYWATMEALEVKLQYSFPLAEENSLALSVKMLSKFLEART